MANIANQTITKSKQKAFIILFNKVVESKGSENKGVDFIGINPETMWRWRKKDFMTLRTAEKILKAYNKIK